MHNTTAELTRERDKQYSDWKRLFKTGKKNAK